jgi:hypothetical protein
MVRPIGSGSTPAPAPTPTSSNNAQSTSALAANTQPVLPAASSASELTEAADAAWSRLDQSARQTQARVESNAYVLASSVDLEVVSNINRVLDTENIVPANLKPSDCYRKLLQLSQEKNKKWPDLAMQLISKIDRRSATKIRREGQPLSSEVHEIKKIINDNKDLNLALSKIPQPSRKFEALLDHFGSSGKDFSHNSMADAVGLNNKSISRILTKRAPLSASAAAIRAEVALEKPSLAFLKAILECNAARVANKETSWSEEDMISASGVRKDNAIKAMEKFELVGSQSAVSATSSALSIKRENPSITDNRPAKRPLSKQDSDHIHLEKVDPAEIARISAAVREHGLDINAATAGQCYEVAFRLASAQNSPWSDAAMQEFAGISAVTASRIRKKMAPDSPRTMAVKKFIEGNPALMAELNGQPSATTRFHTVMTCQVKNGQDFYPRSVATAVGMDSRELARNLKVFEPLTQAALDIRSEVPEIAPPRKYFRAILNANEYRVTSGQPAWLEVDMIAAARIRADYARLVLKERASSEREQPPAIKKEDLTPIIIPHLEEVELDMSRMAFCDVWGDLTGKGVSWVAQVGANTKATIQDMKPNPAMDNVFPIRDPRNPGRPHPAYADTHGNIGQSRVGEVSIGRGFITYLKEFSEQERLNPPSERRLNLSNSKVRSAINLLQENVQRELSRMLLKQAQARPVVSARVLTDTDVLPHEKPLIGQHGLFIHPKLPSTDRPTLSNGKILGIYAGARLETDEDYDVNKATYGEEEFERYSLATAINAVTYSPLGGANSMAFANTALDPDSIEPAYDEKRLNTTFIPFNVQMTDREGVARKEAVLAMVAFDNLQEQILVDYGDAYLKQFTKP